MPDQKSRTFSIEAVLVGLMFAGLGTWVFYMGTRSWFPELASRHGAGIDSMMIYLLAATGTMLLVGHYILGVFIWKFTRSDRIIHRRASKKLEGRLSLTLGLLMAIVAEGGVLAIGIPVFHEYFATAPPDDSIQVEITGEQFVWNIRYPGKDGVFGRSDPALMDSTTNPLGIDPSDPAGTDDVVEINNLYLEIERPVKVVLRSKDVLHSFFLPHFRVKQDAVPGMSIPIWFVPTLLGDFPIACAELCGLAHYRMQGVVHVLSAADFDAWTKEKEAEA